MLRVSRTLFLILAVLLTLSSVAVFFSNFSWLQEPLRLFGEFFVWGHLFALVALLFFRPTLDKRVFAVLACFQVYLACVALRVVLPFYIAPDPFTEVVGKERLSVLLVTEGNKFTVEELENTVDLYEPDLLMVTGLRKNFDNYRFLAHKQLRFSPYYRYGVGLFSQHPLSSVHTGVEPSLFGEDVPPAVLEEVEINGRSLLISLFDGLVVRDRGSYEVNRLITRRVSSFLRHYEGDLIVGGDFGVSPYSRFYQILIYGARMWNASFGEGVVGTYDLGRLLPSIPLAHILHRRDNLRVTEFKDIWLDDSRNAILYAKFGYVNNQ